MGSSVASSISTKSSFDKSINFCNMPPAKDIDRLPASIRDELRLVVALYCMEIIFQKNAMKVAEMRQLMFNLYHGNDRTNTFTCDIYLVEIADNVSAFFDDMAFLLTLADKNTMTLKDALMMMMMHGFLA